MRVRIRKKAASLVFKDLSEEDHLGITELGEKTKIVVDKRIRGVQRLYVLIHETLHACQWDLSEEAVVEVAASMARLLWNLGYRVRGKECRSGSRLSSATRTAAQRTDSALRAVTGTGGGTP